MSERSKPRTELRGPVAGAPGTSPDDRRQARRRYQVEVGVASDHNFYTGFTEDISSGGLFVATHDILPIGTRFRMSLRLPNYDQDVVVQCEVRWQRLEQLGRAEIHPGMGVRFVDISPAFQEVVNAFIAVRESIFFDDE